MLLQGREEKLYHPNKGRFCNNSEIGTLILKAIIFTEQSETLLTENCK